MNVRMDPRMWQILRILLISVILVSLIGWGGVSISQEPRLGFIGAQALLGPHFILRVPSQLSTKLRVI